MRPFGWRSLARKQHIPQNDERVVGQRRSKCWQPLAPRSPGDGLCEPDLKQFEEGPNTQLHVILPPGRPGLSDAVRPSHAGQCGRTWRDDCWFLEERMRQCPLLAAGSIMVPVKPEGGHASTYNVFSRTGLKFSLVIGFSIHGGETHDEDVKSDIGHG